MSIRNVEQHKIPLRYKIALIGIMVSAFFSIYAETLNKIGLYVIIPLCFVLCFNIAPLRKSVKYLIFLYLWISFSALFATDTVESFASIKRVVGCFMLCFILVVLTKNQKLTPYLYCLGPILLIAIWYYAQTTNLLLEIEFGQDRLNADDLNANTFGYYTFYATFGLFMLGEITKKPIMKVMRILFLLIIPLSFLTAMYTGSRQVLVIQIPFLLFLLYLRFWYLAGRVKYVWLLITILCVASGYYYWEHIYENSILQARTETNVKDDERSKLLYDAIQIGLDHPVLGVGPRNAYLYTRSQSMAHNSYAEIFADTGIIGLLIFSFMILSYLRDQRMRYRLTKNRIFLLFYFFGIMWAVYQIFYVFYDSLWLIAFFILVSTHSDSYFMEISRTKIEKNVRYP